MALEREVRLYLASFDSSFEIGYIYSPHLTPRSKYMVLDQSSDSFFIESEDLDPIVERKTVEVFLEINSGKLSIFEAGTSREDIASCPGTGLLELEAERGRWKVELDLEKYEEEQVGGVLQLRARFAAQEASDVPASHEHALIYTSGGTNGIFDSAVNSNLEDEQFRDKVLQAFEPTEAQIEQYMARYQEREKPKDDNLLSIFAQRIEAAREALNNANAEERLRCEETLQIFVDAERELRETIQFSAELQRHSAHTAMQSFTIMDGGLFFRTGCGDGSFGVTLGRNLSGKIVSVDIDFEKIPK